MRIAIDLDNTIDATPKQFQSMMSALIAGGNKVTVLTGTDGDVATQEIWDAKAQYLNSLGCGSCWTDMTVIPHMNGNGPELKAQWCKDNGVDILIDNSKDNAKASIAVGVPLVLVPWATRS